MGIEVGEQHTYKGATFKTYHGVVQKEHGILERCVFYSHKERRDIQKRFFVRTMQGNS